VTCCSPIRDFARPSAAVAAMTVVLVLGTAGKGTAGQQDDRLLMFLFLFLFLFFSSSSQIFKSLHTFMSRLGGKGAEQLQGGRGAYLWGLRGEGGPEWRLSSDFRSAFSCFFFFFFFFLFCFLVSISRSSVFPFFPSHSLLRDSSHKKKRDKEGHEKENQLTFMDFNNGQAAVCLYLFQPFRTPLRFELRVSYSNSSEDMSERER